MKPLTGLIPRSGDALPLADYAAAGGYQAVRKALGEMTPSEIIQVVKDSGLRGRGGAGFGTGLKWSFVPAGPDAPRPRHLVANADEMEPGTFKDRLLLEGNPHQLLEGMILASYAIQAEHAWIFLRWEYRLAARRLRAAIAEAAAAGWLGRDILGSGWSLDLRLHVSAGRYMCGEETGLLNALEGRRATPRAKPPFPQASGLWGRPTVVQNVETLCNIPHIVARGPAWFRSLGRGADAGTKLYGASGKVRRPGLWELPMGVTAREVIEGHAGGMREGLRLRGFLPGGASTDFLSAGQLDVAMEFDAVALAGSRLGTGTIVALDDRTCPVGMVLNLETFFAQESCGWCTPCREGLRWAADLLSALESGHGRPEDVETLAELAASLAPGSTYCALAPGAAEPLQSALLLFGDDFRRHVTDGRCPYSLRAAA
ncbi:MAG TPA: NADH-quinone oxidoreductase subunit NuoF [Candidatus Polarisedimenticolia bacterium]|nr:NADH-quinone oxidoreductase subunit NuoF [Candidatus Polarisedimenticolia bacterium]